MVSYEYDTWGKMLAIKDGAGNDVSGNASHIANLNPFRYRGYYYDSETGLYYLNSRYYDPVTSRYLNADSAIGQIGNVQGYNMFAYCFNNPVNMDDPSGHWPKLSTILFGVAIAAVAVAAVAAVVVTCGAAAPVFAAAGGGIIAGGGLSAGAIATTAAIGSAALTVAKEAAVAGATAYVAEKATEKVLKQNNTVYALKDDSGTVQYVGRTINVDKRKKAHDANPARAGLRMEILAENLNLAQARAVEQAGMAYYHTINTTNKMNNQINGIAPSKWGAFKEVGVGLLNYGYNQATNEILYWTGN